MKYAIVEGVEKIEATKGAKGTCPCCGSDLIAKCGEIKIDHWAHKGIRNCDLWWENETEWHRLWKDFFPKKWQEVVHHDKNGEKHIADVKTDEGWVLEFQHSFLAAEERRSRNAFYSKLVWIVDGLRRERDKSQFQKVINEGSGIKMGNIVIHRVSFLNESKLLKEWHDSGVPVFFDFQESNDAKLSRLWLLIPQISNDKAYLIPFSYTNFIELHNNKGFDELAQDIIPKIQIYLRSYEQQKLQVNFNYRLRYRPRYRRRF